MAAGALLLMAAACGSTDQASTCTLRAQREITATADRIGQPAAAILVSRREWPCAETSQGHALDLVFDFDGTAEVALDHYDSRLVELGWQLLRQDDASSTWSKRVGRSALVLNVHKSVGDDSITVSIAEQEVR